MMERLEKRTENEINLEKLMKKIFEIPGERWREVTDGYSINDYVYDVPFGKIGVGYNDRLRSYLLSLYNSLGEQIYWTNISKDLLDKIKREREEYRERVMENDAQKLNDWINE